jgi:outer membrane protein
MTKPIIDKINKILEKIGKDEEYDLIMDARMGGVVYAKEKFDLTDRVVKILNKE